MDNFENEEWDTLDFASGVKKEKPKDLYNILETTIDSMGIVEPATKPMNQVVLAEANPIPEIAKPIDINKTHQEIGNLFTDYGQSEILKRRKDFERQQRSNQTFGYRNASYTPTESNQGGFIRTSGNATPAASSTAAGTVTDFSVPAVRETVADFAVDMGQSAVMGGTVPARARSLAETPTPAPVQQQPVTQQATTTTQRIPGINLSPMQIDRATYIRNRLIADGFTQEQASGILGNLIEESQLDHMAVHPDGGTFGIAQWRGSRIRDYEREIGPRSETTFEKQVDFLIHELNDKERGASRRIRNARTVDEAALIAREKFERPDPRQPHDDRRRRYSHEVHRLYQHNQTNRQ